MQSTNFEFMREHRPNLADSAAVIEHALYADPSSATDLLRTFGERLLQHFLEATGEPICDSPGDTFGFEVLIDRYSKHGKPLQEAQRKQFHKLRLEGNKQHDPRHAPTRQDVQVLLEVAWQLARWVGEQLDWQGIPNSFETPPEGGHALLEMQRRLDDQRRQKVAALQREADAKRSYDVSGWICQDQGKVPAPPDFVGRTFVFDKMKSFLASSERSVLVIQGQPGRGKTAIIQQFLGEECPVGISPFIFYFRDQESRADPARWIRHLYASLVKRCDLPPPSPSILQAKPEDLVQRLRNGIEEAAQKHPDMRLLFLIDGIDEAGPADELVWSFSTSMFPSTVKVIATTRRMHRSVSPKSANEQLPISSFDLDKYRTEHDVDGRKWVEKTMPSLPKPTIDRVVQLSDANFLVLRGICRELREVKEPEIADRLRELSEHKAAGKDLVRELYERTWKRLERLPVENLDRVGKLAALLANASVPLSERTVKDILKLRNAEWVNLQQCFAEYIVHSRRYPSHGEDTWGTTGSKGGASTSEPIPVVRLFHQTFAEFVRDHLRDDLTEANTSIADYCLEQIRNRKAGYEYEYAVKFGPEHLCRAERWSDLEALLTDLEFVEEKCKQQMVRELAEDYQLARQYHRGWKKAIVNELRHEENLSRWAADVMKEGMRWRAELNRKWESADSDLVELSRPYRFPTPPDTSELCDRLLNESPTLEDQFNPAITTLQILRSFVTCLADRLARHPEATLSFALNYHSALAEQAEDLLRSRDVSWFEEYPRRHVDPHEIPLPTLQVDASSFAVSANGEWCVTGEKNGTLRFWDLVTGNEVDCNSQEHQGAVTHILLSVDGSRSISFASDGSIATHELQNGRWQSRRLELNLPPVTATACSPEGSVVVAAGGDDKIRVFDGQTGQLLTKKELFHHDLQGIMTIHLIPERFEIRAGDRTGNVAVWDLGSRELIGIKPADTVPIPDDFDEDFEPHGWLNSELPVSAMPRDDRPESINRTFGQFWNLGLVSADGQIAIVNDLSDSDSSLFYCSGRMMAIIDGDTCGFRLTADGRVVWMNCGSWIEGCDVTKISKIVTGPKERYDRPIRHDPSRFDMAFDFPSSPEDETETTNFTIVISVHGPGSEEDVTDDDERKESEDDAETSAATTADGCIAIRVVDAEELESDDDEECQSQDLLLHSIHVPVDPDDSSTCSFYVRVSPSGQRAFIAVSPDTQPARWFLWDIPKGKKAIPHVSTCWDFVDVMPDWKSVVTIEDEMVMICDLETGERLRRLPVSGATAITPDGRNLVDYTDDGISVWPLAQSQPSPIRLKCPGLRRTVVSPDGKLLVCSFDDCLRVYDLGSGTQLVDQPFRYVNRGDSWRMWRQNPRMDFDGLIFDMSTRPAGWDPPLMLRNLPPYAEEEMTPLVTATRVFRYQLDDSELQQLLAGGGPLPSDYELPGEFDAELTTVCPKCGNRFAVPDGVERAIDELLRSAGIAPNQSPCLSLPDSAWADPELKCQCTHCQQSLRLNPFLVLPVR